MTLTNLLRGGAVALGTLLVPAVAFAHPGHEALGFAAGVAHPLSGLDHVLAMALVGVFAWQLGGRALWLVPATFVAMMVAGGALGAMGIGLPLVEIGIAASVVALGAAVALRLRLPTAVAMIAVGLFAVFHGHAHGTEMPETAAGLAYGAGFVLSTVLLHLAGIAGSVLLGSLNTKVVRAGGGLAAIAGLALFLS